MIDPSIGGFYQNHVFRRSFVVDTQTIASAPLPPVEVKLFNDGSRDVQVQINDLLDPGNRQSMRIAPQTAATVALQRDPGATRVHRYQVIDGFGNWATRETSFAIPSPIRYELVVHEWTMQSIAIDRTGKSPQKIEDIQFQGRGLGRFLLPPGDQLRAGTIPVVQTAKRQGNPGAVSPLLPQEASPSQQLSPLERALRDLQKPR